MEKTVLDLFCGAGGFAAGFQITGGYNIIVAIDSGYEVSLTYKHNFPHVTFVNEDIHELHSEDILEKAKTVPDVIIASPPCEPYTSANTYRQKDPLTRLYDDEAGRLVLDTIRIIGDIHPNLFVIENVPELMSGELKWALQREFQRVKYDDIYFNVLLAEDYGSPSTRTRLFISNIRLEPIRLKNRLTVQRVLNLPEPTTFHDFVNHQYYPIISPKKMKKIHNLKPGSAMVYYRAASQKTYTNWVRLDPYELAPTVIGHSRFIHPFEDRVLSVRENARLMGFPDNFKFLGGIDDQYTMVGEAVPPPLSAAIAKYCLKWLNMSGDSVLD